MDSRSSPYSPFYSRSLSILLNNLPRARYFHFCFGHLFNNNSNKKPNFCFVSLKFLYSTQLKLLRKNSLLIWVCVFVCGSSWVHVLAIVSIYTTKCIHRDTFLIGNWLDLKRIKLRKKNVELESWYERARARDRDGMKTNAAFVNVNTLIPIFFARLVRLLFCNGLCVFKYRWVRNNHCNMGFSLSFCRFHLVLFLFSLSCHSHYIYFTN